MGLKEFDFIEESIDMLRTMSPTLETISDEIESILKISWMKRIKNI